jgi:transcriptional regulator with XRE-family HTH domain
MSIGGPQMETDLKSKRIKTRLKQLEVAKLTGIDHSRLSLIENGWVDPKPEELRKIEAVISIYAKNS